MLLSNGKKEVLAILVLSPHVVMPLVSHCMDSSLLGTGNEKGLISIIAKVTPDALPFTVA